jgi:hypothetical protein
MAIVPYKEFIMLQREWNIQQLNMRRIEDLNKCTNSSEYSMADAICKKEILDLAKSKTKLSPIDIAILNSLFPLGTVLALPAAVNA